MARYCDDFVMGFQREEDARRIYEVLPKRLTRFGLTMHPEKSRIVDFRPPPYRISRTNLKEYERDVRKIQSFDFLGFSHTWRRSQKGNWVVFRGTMKSRLDRGLASVSLWCKRHRHAPIKHQANRLQQFLYGHYAYYGVSGNYRNIKRFYRVVIRIWKKWLMRRTQRHRINWEAYNRLLKRFPLPIPRLRRPYQQFQWNV